MGDLKNGFVTTVAATAVAAAIVVLNIFLLTQIF
jgi:Mn2+/Fe2+ NRAMP family transporter